MKNTSGSTWAKWDLHVHTPYSALNNGFGSDWDEYVKQLFKRAIQEKIQVIGITDYFLIDGYKKIVREYIQNDNKLKNLFSTEEINLIKKIKLFPNVEFRLKTFVGKDANKVNFHVVFSDELEIEDIEENFLNKIEFQYDASSINGISTRSLTKRNLEILGSKLKQEQEEFKKDSDVFVGMKNAFINHESISDVLKSQFDLFDKKYLIGVEADEDLSNIDWRSQDHLVRKILIKLSHFLFSKNNKTRKWALGELSNKQDHIKEFESLKSCLGGSDAHDFDKLFKPDQERHTWIKASPSFNGLLQITYEPESRVKIQGNNPEAKHDYNVISRARFIPGSTNKEFSPNWININSNLNTIIGGKSSGKSLFLYYLAKTANPDETTKVVGTSKELTYDFEKVGDFNFEIEWKDGHTSKLSGNKDHRTRKITYIPQLYINKIVDGQEDSFLNQAVQDVLNQNETYKIFHQDYQEKIARIKIEIHGGLSVLFACKGKQTVLKNELNKIGDLETLKAELQKTNKHCDNLSNNSQLTKKERKDYDKLQTEIESLTNKINKVNSKISLFTNIKQFVEMDLPSQISDIFIDKKEELNKRGHLESHISDALIIIDGLSKAITENIPISAKQIDNEILNNNKFLGVSNKSIKLKKEELKKYSNKIKNQDELNELSKKKTVLLANIEKIKELTKQINSQDSALEKNYESLWVSKGKITNLHHELIQKLVELELTDITPEIKLDAQFKYNWDSFKKSFSRCIDGRTLRKASKDFDDFSISDIQNFFKIENLQFFFSQIMKGEIKVKSGFSEENVIDKLLDDYSNLDFNIQYKGDDLQKMSPGKKGLVVLQLIVHLSNSTHPILIDQPEDNLDNRTIFNELSKFIKSKKESRQIILVSHNPNLVVSTDSENVVVSNQKGQDNKEDKQVYRFEYLTGPLEYSFSGEKELSTLNKLGVKEHVCEILEGGREAFIARQKKYSIR